MIKEVDNRIVELRQKNWIFRTIAGRSFPVMVTKVGQDSVWVSYQGHSAKQFSITSPEIAGILLSPKILRSFGFQYNEAGTYEISHSNIQCILEQKAGMWRFIRPYETGFTMKFVHQFQNLFLELMRKEYCITEEMLSR